MSPDIGINKIGTVHTITSIEPLKPRFWDNSVIYYILVVNNNKYLSYVVDNIIILYMIMLLNISKNLNPENLDFFKIFVFLQDSMGELHRDEGSKLRLFMNVTYRKG